MELAISLLEGLSEAHRQGVIHRDLKPENVFLCASPPCIKILDFGISVLSEARPARGHEPDENRYFVGTPVYTPLERLREKQPFDHRVDLYSVGVILYEVLTGALPFSGRTPSELAYQLAVSAPQPPRALRPDLLPALEAVVLESPGAGARRTVSRRAGIHRCARPLRSIRRRARAALCGAVRLSPLAARSLAVWRLASARGPRSAAPARAVRQAALRCLRRRSMKTPRRATSNQGAAEPSGFRHFGRPYPSAAIARNPAAHRRQVGATGPERCAGCRALPRRPQLSAIPGAPS